MTVSIKTPDEIKKMEVAGRLASEVLEMIERATDGLVEALIS